MELKFEQFPGVLLNEILNEHNRNASYSHNSPQNLNAVCRKQTNRNASAIITAQILLEAKRYILHTDNTVNEIA